MFIVIVSLIRNGRFSSSTHHDYATLDEAVDLVAKIPSPFYVAIMDRDSNILLDEMPACDLNRDNIQSYLKVVTCSSVW